MASFPIKIPEIADKDKTPLVKELTAIIESQNMKIRQLAKAAVTTKQTEIEDPARLNIYNVLKGKRSFGQMPDEMLRRLVKNMKVLRMKKGENVLKQGEPSSFVYLLLRGHVSVLVDEQLVYKFERIGDIFGEMSYINQTVCSATIRAESDLELIAISQKMLKHIGNEDFFLWLCRILSDKLNRTSKQLSQSNSPTPQDSKKLDPEKPPEDTKPVKTEESQKVTATSEQEEESQSSAETEELFEEEATNLDDIPTNPDDFFGTE